MITDLPLDTWTDPDEYGIRNMLYRAWQKSVSEFQARLLIAADWFADRDHPDEAVCRAAWTPSAPVVKMGDTPCCSTWTVTPVKPTGRTRRQARMGKSETMCNAYPWLCWDATQVRRPACYAESGGKLVNCKNLTYVAEVRAWKFLIRPPIEPTLASKGNLLLLLDTPYAVDVLSRHEWTALFHPLGTLD